MQSVARAGGMDMPQVRSRTKSMIGLALTLPLIPVMLKFAGAGFSSSQDTPFSNMAGPGSAAAAMPSLVFAYLTALVAIALVAPHYRLIGREFFRDRLASLLLGLVVLTSLWSQDPIVSIKQAAWLCISVLFVYWVKIRLSARQQMEVLMIVGAVAGVLSIAVVFLLPSYGLDALHDKAWQGVFFSKNHMGRIFLFLLTPALCLKPRSSVGSWVRSAYVVLMLFLIGMSQSRSAWLFTALYLLFAAAMKLSSWVSRREVYRFVLLAAVIVIGVGVLIAVNADAILSLLGRDVSLTGRTTIWNILMISVHKRPLLGYGYQAFWSGGTSEGMNAVIAEHGMMHFFGAYAHSGYLSVLLEEGFIGLVLTVLLLCQGIRDALVCLRDSQTLNETYWYSAIIFITVVYNIDEVTLLLPTYLPWMLCLLAVSALSTKSRRIRAAQT
jgi:exopolysaccharide production protein ExoQ